MIQFASQPSLPDPRTKDWFLMQSPWPMLAMFTGYLAMCAVGPRLMRNRQPFELNSVMIVYNLVMVGLSLHMFLEVFTVIRIHRSRGKKRVEILAKMARITLGSY